MTINSFAFILAFPFIFSLYWVIPERLKSIRKWILLITSIILYGSFSPWFLFVLFYIIISSYFAAIWITTKSYMKRKDIIVKMWTLAAVVLTPLFFFKYYNFLCENLCDLFNLFNINFNYSFNSIVAPIGLSFFTFQALGYVIDVYRGCQSVEKNFLDYCLFIVYFPQIVSGPISKASELLPQIKKLPNFDYKKATNGLRLLLWGMFLKTVIADRACIYVNLVYDKYESLSGFNCVVASFMYTIQIYCDFAGYSLMAVGISKTLGFDIINNFRRPYFATSFTDFWRRWHISLTRWLTQYVYIGLGGNRLSKSRTYLNIMITFLVSGLWHGANWTFVLWGGLHGLFQVIEKSLGLQKCNTKGVIKVLRIICVFCLVNVFWVFFRSASVRQAFEFLSMMVFVPGFNMEGMETLTYFGIGFSWLFVFELLREFFPFVIIKYSKSWIVRWGFYMIMTVFILLMGVFDGSQFIYANF